MVNTKTDNLNFSPRLLAEYPMWGHDYNRYNEWLKEIEKYCAISNSTAQPTLEVMQNYFVSLLVLYGQWKPLISNKPQIDKFETMLEEGKKLKRVWERSEISGQPINLKIIHNFIDILNNFYRDLMNMKQLIGLGIPVKRNLSANERIKIGMRGPSKKARLLPDV